MLTLIRLILMSLFIADIIVSYKIFRKINKFYIDYEKVIEEMRLKDEWGKKRNNK